MCVCVCVCVCVCMYTATGHNNSVLSLDVHDELMITGSKGNFLKNITSVYIFGLLTGPNTGKDNSGISNKISQSVRCPCHVNSQLRF